jgi:protocatechuate 3,4-dioxygenase, alpha subunit
MSNERLGQTPWQTVGPFFHYALPWKGGADLVGSGGERGTRLDLLPEGHYQLNENDQPRKAPQGEIIEISGRVTDCNGDPVGDALIEIWQPNAAGRFASPADTREDLPLDEDFIGFGRCSTQNDGSFSFRTVKPGPVPGPGNSLQAPHIAVGVFGRGLLKRLCTRIYFDGDAANADDPILALVPADRRQTLLAGRDGEAWRFDIRIGTDDETVFFDV